MSVEIIKKFNEILESFLLQVSPIVGPKYHKKFKMAVKFNSSLALEKFLVYVLPVRDKIINRDETYFTNYNPDTSNDSDMEMVKEFVNLREIYQKLNKDSMDNVWDIFQALLILGEDYIRIKN